MNKEEFAIHYEPDNGWYDQSTLDLAWESYLKLPKPISGYTFVISPKHWSEQTDWSDSEIIVYSPTGNEVYCWKELIDDSDCYVWALSNGDRIAQTVVSVG